MQIDSAKLAAMVQALIAQHEYSPDESIGTSVEEHCDLIKEIKELGGLFDAEISVTDTYDASDGTEYIEVRYEIAGGFILASPEQLDPQDYQGENFAASVEMFVTDVCDRAERIRERFNQQYVLAADWVTGGIPA